MTSCLQVGSTQVVSAFAKVALSVITSTLGSEALSQSSQQQDSPGHSLLARMQSGSQASSSQSGVHRAQASDISLLRYLADTHTHTHTHTCSRPLRPGDGYKAIAANTAAAAGTCEESHGPQAGVCTVSK